MSEKTESAGDAATSPDPEVYLATLDMAGGGTKCLASTRPLMFFEAVCKQPISRLFNQCSGASGGAGIATPLNIPRSKGSKEPLYSAVDSAQGYEQTLKAFIPHRRFYHQIRLGLGLAKGMISLSKKAATLTCKEIDYWINFGISTIGHSIHRNIGAKKPYAHTEFSPLTVLNSLTINPLLEAFGNAVNWISSKAQHDIHILHDINDAVYRFPDTGERITLDDTIVSHHISAFNMKGTKSVFFHHHENMKGETTHVSHPGMHLDDITTGSCAALGVSSFHQARDGMILVDVATFNTPLTSASAILGQNDGGHKIRLISIGSGTNGTDNDEDISTEYLDTVSQLHEGLGELGKILSGIDQTFIAQRDEIVLKHILGDENVVNIDIPLTVKFFQSAKYASNPKLVRAAKMLGFDLNEWDQMDSWQRVPAVSAFDTSPRNIENCKTAGWDMVWHNFETLIEQSKFLVQNSANQGRIPQEEARKIIEDIEWLYPSGDSLPDESSQPHSPFQNLKEAQSKFVIEIPKPKKFRDNLSASFGRNGRESPRVVRRSSFNDNNEEGRVEGGGGIGRFLQKLKP